MKTATLLQKKVLEIDSYLNNLKIFNQNNKSIFFAIPLKSKKVSRDWSVVQRNLQKTLCSILGNTKNNYQIIIAGHEKPSFPEINNPKVTWITAQFPPPKSPMGFNRDKEEKLKLIAQYLKSQKENGYIFPFDGDDLVHYRFIEYINSLPTNRAFLINKSLMCNLSQNDVWLLDRFYLKCGSGGIHPFTYDSFLNPKERDNYMIRLITSHIHVVKNLRRTNIKYQLIEHPLVLRNFGHSDNNMILKKTLDKNVNSSTYNQLGEELKTANWIKNFYRYDS